MSLKWIFWTGLLAVLVFFGVIYFGIKYEWVGGSRPTSSQTKTLQPPKPESKTRSASASYLTENVSGDIGNGVNPELIDEAEAILEERVLGVDDLTIEEVVSQCQQLSETIGVPLDRLDQSISECVDRNSTHLSSDAENNQSQDERDLMIREQCEVAITQKDLLSAYEVKMLVDECVASMSVN